MPKPSRSRRQRGRAVGEMLRSGNTGLGKLVREAKKLEALDNKLTGLLEPEMAKKVRVAALHEATLTLVTPSAALATRLKLDADSLLQALRATGVEGVTGIRVRTAPLPERKEPTRKRKRLPEIARRSLERFARDSGDEEIRELVSKSRTRKS